MYFELHKPTPPLSEFVELFWYWHDPEPGPSAKERVLPTGTVEFVIRLTENQNRVFASETSNVAQVCSGTVLTGPQKKFFVLDKREQDHLVGVHFKPGGAYPFFGVPADALQNVHVSLSDLRGLGGEALRAQLLETKSVAEKFQVLEAFLLQSLSALEIHPAVKLALAAYQSAPSTSVSAMADRVGLSQRRFIQLFSRHVGLTPKLFSRVQRFQNVLQSIHGRNEVDWTDAALASGYFDQAHFNHEFKEFTGIRPSDYLAIAPEHLNHVAMG